MEKAIKATMVVMTGMLLMLPMMVGAQVLPEPTVPDVCTGIFCQGLTLDTISAIIERIAEFLITVAIVVAIIFIIWGAVTYIFAGANDEQRKAAGKRIWHGIIGAAIILAVGVILQTVARIVSGGFF